MRPVRAFFDAFKSIFHTFFWDDFREGLIDLRSVGWDVRILMVAGLAILLATLAATLFFGHGAVLLGPVVYQPDLELPETLSIPFVALVLVTLVFAVGWGYLLVGAARCKFWVFLIVGGIFAMQMLVMANALTASGTAALVYLYLLVGSAVAAFVSYFVLRRLRKRAWVAMLEPLWWLALTAVFVVLIWINGESNAAVASYFGVSVGLVFVLAGVYWFYLSLDVVDMSVRIGQQIVGGTRLLLTPQLARWLILVFLLIKPLLAFGLFGVTAFDFLALDVFASLALALVACILLPLRRYSPTAAYVLLGLSIALTVFSYALELATEGSDFSSLLLETVGLESSLISFVVLTLWDMASSGARFANTDGRHLPRAGRMLLYAGGLMQVSVATLFYTASGDPQLQELANNAFLGGAGTLGLLYLVYIIWRQRYKLIGSAVDVTEGVVWQHRLPKWVLPLFVVGVAGSVCLVCLAVWLIWLWPSFAAEMSLMLSG